MEETAPLVVLLAAQRIPASDADSQVAVAHLAVLGRDLLPVRHVGNPEVMDQDLLNLRYIMGALIGVRDLTSQLRWQGTSVVKGLRA
ncbi:hypothetical protein ISF_06266 [Cordyceps fumosorosea ARSEF 2679]|uniref:Uncharacterized protein n=1 Tax=Cordyceps fumosorosea (strain ARSEF 2679) TaxID=1081104 RepID=A0A167S795_CORFA|nr:hypothetical protein ISF_06266 [Cordyceps fumosorosea ARSEF 2679]OAA59331.1 hypothetical protein ISF_06266 [Cordyceps fumosorosea ARSEF 2679]